MAGETRGASVQVGSVLRHTCHGAPDATCGGCVEAKHIARIAALEKELAEAGEQREIARVLFEAERKTLIDAGLDQASDLAVVETERDAAIARAEAAEAALEPFTRLVDGGCPGCGSAPRSGVCGKFSRCKFGDARAVLAKRALETKT